MGNLPTFAPIPSDVIESIIENGKLIKENGKFTDFRANTKWRHKQAKQASKLWFDTERAKFAKFSESSQIWAIWAKSS